MQTTQPTPTEADAHILALLNEVLEGAADLARRILEESRATPTYQNITPAADATIPYERATRILRRTAVLAHNLAHGTLARPAQATPAAKPAAQPAPNPAAARTETRARILRSVEDAIHRRRHETDADALYAELHERLDDSAFEQDLDTRPIEDLIEELSRDLGVATQARSFVWKRRTPQDIHDLRARAQATPAPTNTPTPTPSPQPETPAAGHLHPHFAQARQRSA